MGYKYYNPNPHGLNTGDCVVRAIAKATGKGWRAVYQELCVRGLALGDMPSANRVWNDYLTHIGFRRYVIPNTCPNCYTVRDFAEDYPQGVYILATGTHVVTVIDGTYYDAWDSGDRVPIFYFRRA